MVLLELQGLELPGGKGGSRGSALSVTLCKSHHASNLSVAPRPLRVPGPRESPCRLALPEEEQQVLADDATVDVRRGRPDYPRAERQPVVERLHGRLVRDPYRW